MAKKPKNEDDPKPVVPDLDTKQVTKALMSWVDPREYACFAEVSTISGKKLDQGVRFMDVWAIRFWGLTETICYEVKVSRADFKHEISKPLKRKEGMRLSNLFYFVCPANMIDVSELPPDAGLIFVNEDLSLTTVCKAPYRDVSALPKNFLAVILRKLDKERLYSFLQNLGDDELNEAVGGVALEVIENHVEKWEAVNYGDKTVPDKIALALKDLKHDILYTLVERKIYK